MASLDIKSIVVTLEAKSSSASMASIEAGHKINDYSKPALVANNNAYEPAVAISPLFIMTPDGVVHVKIDKGHHSPEITLRSFNMAKNSEF